MLKKVKVKGKEIEIFFAEDGYIEVYDVADPAHTGFIFNNIKQLNMFVNYLTDVVDEYNMEVNNE